MPSCLRLAIPNINILLYKTIVIGNCRTLEFRTTVDGHALLGHVVKKFPVNTPDDCEFKCYLETECMSINIGPGDNGAYQCELSDCDHNSHPEDLKQRDGFAYRPTVKVSFTNKLNDTF